MKKLFVLVVILFAAVWIFYPRPSAAPFVLPHTDPTALHAATQQLASVQEKLAHVQATPQESAEVESLYPVDFLFALADLEAARRALNASHSATDEKAYNVALTRARDAGTSDIAHFREAFDATVGTTSAKFPSLGGTITTESMRATIADIADGFQNLAPKPVELTQAIEISTTTLPQDERDVVSLLAQAGNAPLEIYRLEQSRCLGALPSPYFVSASNATTSARFLNDLFFVPTDQPGLVLGYLHDTLHMSYTPTNPMTFYTCPDYGSDLSQMGVGLDTIVAQIAAVEENDLRLYNSGVHFDLSAKYLFLTHSAFPTLYQSYNPSFGSHAAPLRIQSSSDLQLILTKEIPFSTLQDEVPRNTLVHDLKAYFDFEKEK